MSTNRDSALELGGSSDRNENNIGDIVFDKHSQSQLAWEDILSGTKKWRIWLMLAWRDISVRYRRSVLGPFWITLSMAITVYSMGYLYAHLFHIELQQYYPLLVSGMLSWSLISTMVIESTDGFIASANLINQIKLPYSVHIHRIVSRNFIIFFHNLVVLIPILIIFHDFAKINWHTLMIFPALLYIYINSMIFGTILAMLGGRYRDLSQVIKSLVQVIFFVTPVMWDASILPERVRFVADFNPFYAFLELVREPMIGRLPSLHNIEVALFVTAIGTVMSFKLFAHYRSRIVYWL